MLAGNGLLKKEFFINSFASPRDRVLFDAKVLLVGSPSGDGQPQVGRLLRGGVFALGFDPRVRELITRELQGES